MIFITFLLLIAGILILVRGADVLVDGARSIAKHIGVSDIVAGVTIVAFGTSLPELFVSVQSALSGNTDLAVANVLGSNILNTLLILGLCALAVPLTLKKQTVWREVPLGLLAALLLFTMGSDTLIDGAGSSVISSSEGLTLLVFFVLYIGYMFVESQKHGPIATIHTNKYSAQVSIGYLLLGLIALIFGGKLVTENAMVLGEALGISQTVLGITVVAIGTSLPELITSLAAVKKGSADIAVGNIVGSNIFNIFFVLGVTAFIHPLPTSLHTSIDSLIAALSSFVLFGAMFVGVKHTIQKSQAILMLATYCIYILYIVQR
jgi:cation:H+ antiporter